MSENIISEEEKKSLNHYCYNLDTPALIMMVKQLVCYPETRDFIIKSAVEFQKMYHYPLQEDR